MEGKLKFPPDLRVDSLLSRLNLIHEGLGALLAIFLHQFLNQALSLYKKAKRILKDAFSSELALVILSQVHETVAAIQKQEEEARLSKKASDTESSNS
jgi:hypothetical protein